jgi:hypothetical protein
MKTRLTVGCRARILTLKEKLKQEGPKFPANENFWRKQYGGHEVLLIERCTNGDFSALVLGKEVKELKKEDHRTVIDSIAWVSEDDLKLVDQNFNANLDFIDWYQEHEDEFCPDCGVWFPENSLTDDDVQCPNKECPGYHLKE